MRNFRFAPVKESSETNLKREEVKLRIKLEMSAAVGKFFNSCLQPGSSFEMFS